MSTTILKRTPFQAAAKSIRRVAAHAGVFLINLKHAIEQAYEMKRLYDLSDVELARRSLRRDQIVPHVMATHLA